MKIEAVIMVQCPEWIGELTLEEKEHIVNTCRKSAECAWNDRLDSFGKVYLANKAKEVEGQISIYEYV